MGAFLNLCRGRRPLILIIACLNIVARDAAGDREVWRKIMNEISKEDPPKYVSHNDKFSQFSVPIKPSIMSPHHHAIAPGSYQPYIWCNTKPPFANPKPVEAVEAVSFLTLASKAGRA